MIRGRNESLAFINIRDSNNVNCCAINCWKCDCPGNRRDNRSRGRCVFRPGIHHARIVSYENTKYVSGRVSEIELQSSCEGSPINRCYGSEVRCSGTCIWVSDLIEVKKTEEPAAVKAAVAVDPEVTTYSYFVDIAIAVCKGPAGSIARIWADGKLLYTNENTYTELSMDGNIVKIRFVSRWMLFMILMRFCLI